MDEEELNHFRSMANSWWDETGDFEALHAMNRLRVPFIRDGLVQNREEPSPDPSLPLQGLRIVDVGSGGGILTEVGSGTVQKYNIIRTLKNIDFFTMYMFVYND